ncbi:MAG: CaiB/BaiF CoA-transferase family protein, partial [Pseudomonadales bacterium]
MKPLEDRLVLALEQAVAAPLCTSRLADAGARVIKVERAEGDFARAYDDVVDGQSAYFVWLNRGKESLVCDIKHSDDQALVHRILERADVFVQNLAPGAAARAGFGSDALRARYPRLITCDISGYGEDGPYRDMKAYDLLVQAESGLVSVTGSPDEGGRVGVSVCDIAAGLNALIGIQQALIQRGQTGRGSSVKVSLFDGMADWMTVPYLHGVHGEAPKRVGLNHPSIAPYGGYRVADGSLIVICVQNQREWVRFCNEVLEQPEMAEDALFADNMARVENRAALDRRITSVFDRHTRESLRRKLDEAAIAYGAVNDVAALAAHPQLRT